jgi:phosphopantothenoylcysteine decarboxylase/phosphopantothenate--cysteine ligase
VRVITNTSTGGTGALLAEHFAACGHDVVLLRAHTARPARCREETYGTFAELDAALGRLLGSETFEVVVHAAAVSDFAVEAVEVGGVERQPGQGKLGSDTAPTIRLKRNPKLLDTLRARSRNPAVCVVAFKLTQGADEEGARVAVGRLLAVGGADFVVHNDLAARGENGGAFPAGIWNRDGEIVAHCANRLALAEALERLCGGSIPGRAPAPSPKP